MLLDSNYLEFCRCVIEGRTLDELPVEYLRINYGQLNQLYTPIELLKRITKSLSETEIAGYYRQLLLNDWVEKESIFKMVEELHGPGIIPQILNFTAEEVEDYFGSPIGYEYQKQVWRKLKLHNPDLAWQIASNKNFGLLLKECRFNSPEALFNEIIDMATMPEHLPNLALAQPQLDIAIGNSRIGQMLQTPLMLAALYYNHYDLFDKIVDYMNMFLGREYTHKTLKSLLKSASSFSNERGNYDAETAVKLIDRIIEQNAITGDDAEEIRINIRQAVIASEIKNSFGYFKKSETGPQEFIEEQFLKLGITDNIQKARILISDNFHLAQTLLSSGQFTYVIEKLLPWIKQLDEKTYQQAVKDTTYFVERFIINKKGTEFAEFVKMLEEVGGDELLMEFLERGKAYVLQTACQHNFAEAVEFILATVYAKKGSTGLVDYFKKSRMFPAYTAGSLEVITIMKKYADLSGDSSIKKQLILNFRHSTFIGAKSERRKNRFNRRDEAGTAKLLEHTRKRAFNQGFDAIALASFGEIANKEAYEEELANYSYSKILNRPLIERITPDILTAVALNGRGIQRDKDGTYVSEFAGNVLQISVFLATIFDNETDICRFIDEHITEAANIFHLAPSGASYMINRCQNIEGWRELYKKDYKTVLKYKDHWLDIEKYTAQTRTGFPTDPAELEIVCQAMIAAKMDVIIRRDDLVQARRNLEKYKLESNFSFGMEQEYFGMKKSSVEPLKQFMERFSPAWVLKEDFGVTYNENVWVGYETNTPITTNENLTDTLLVTWVLNNLRILVNSSCSFHVHIGITNNLAPEAQLPFLKQFALNYIALEEELSFLDHTLTQTYAEVFAKCGLTQEEAYKNIIDAQNVEELILATRPDCKDHPDPTHLSRMLSKLNFNSMEVHGTLEVRHHVGTNRFSDVVTWLMFLDSMVAQTNNMLINGQTPHIPAEAEKFQLSQLVKNYIKARGDTKIVNDQDLPPHQRDLVEGRFRKTDIACAV